MTKKITNVNKIRKLLYKLPSEKRNNFMFFMFGVLNDTINNLDKNSSEMIVLIRELKNPKNI